MSTEIAFRLMLYGFIIAEQLFLAVYFYRSWRVTRESLFGFFTAGFLVMSVHRVWLGLAVAQGVQLEQQTAVFLVRLLAYALIFAGVVAKNLQRRHI